MAEGPARNERQDVFVFLGFVVLCLTVLAVVVIAKNDWPARRWAALGALAALVQAIAVVAALGFAWAQIRTARDEARRRRRDELIDRLQAVVHEELLPAWSTLRREWETAVYTIELTETEFRDDERALAYLAGEYEKDRENVGAASEAMRLAGSRVTRVLQLLGTEKPMVLYRLDGARIPLSSHVLPRRLSDDAADLDREPKGLATGTEAARDVEKWLDGYIAAHVEAGRTQ